MAGTYKEILARFKKDLGNAYQAQKNIVDVSQKYIGLLENAEGGSGAGGIDYSETEQDTGLKWIDGKTIYQKTISLGNLPNSTVASIDHNISNLDHVIYISGFAYRTSDSDTLPLPFVNVSSLSNAIQITCGTAKVNVRTAADQSERIGYVTLKYTKS